MNDFDDDYVGPDEDEVNEKVEDLVDWENPPKLSDLRTDYLDAKTEFDAHCKDVEKWIDNLNGVPKFKVSPKKSKVVPKLIRKQAEWRYSSLEEALLSDEDLYNVAPMTYKDKKAAIQNALILNKQFNVDIDKVGFINEYVRTAVDEGTVIVQVGWEYQEAIEEVEEPNIMEIPITTQQELENAIQRYPDQAQDIQKALQTGQQPIVKIDNGGTKIVEKTVVKTNKPVIDIRAYDTVIIDPTCKGVIEDAQFIVVQTEKTYSDLKSDDRFTNVDNIEIEVSEFNGDVRNYETFKFKDKPRKKVTMFEYWGYWDIDGSGIVKPIVANWVGNTLIRLEESPFEFLPFEIVQYLPKRKEIYGEPDGVLLEDNQDIIGAVTRGILDMMAKSANGQRGTMKGFLDTTNRRRFEAGQDYQFEPNATPAQAIVDGKYPEIPRSALEIINMMNSDAESLTGVKAFSSGISGQALGTTATGIRGALDASSKRELGILRRLAKGIENIGRKVIAMNAMFLSDEEIIRITDNEFISISRDELAGNFDLRLSISTPEVDNQKANDLAFLLQTTAQSMGPEFTTLILSDWARLKHMPELGNKLENWQPTPDETQQQLTQLEMQKLQAEIAERQSRTQENGADLQLKMAKAVNEQSKAEKTLSEKDKLDLDFLKEHSGVKRQEDVEDKLIAHSSALDQKALDHTVNLMQGDTKTNK